LNAPADPVANRAIHDGAVLFYGLAALLVFAPLYWGGNPPLPLMVMELTALALLVWRFGSPPAGGQPLSGPARVFLALLFLLPLAQLCPVPLSFWASLPGRPFYAGALGQAGAAGPGFDWRAISLIPTATESAWLSLLPPLAVFLVAVRLDSQRLLRLSLVFLGIATGEALLGLIQYGNGPSSPFRLGNALMGDSASGTYINRNHLAGLLEMALPMGLALLTATIGHGAPRHSSGGRSRRKRTFRQWLARFSVARINQTAVFTTMSLAILLGLIFTRSRTGISLAMLGILLCALTFSFRLGGRNVHGLMGTFTAMGVGLASLIGLAPIWRRFAYSDPFEDGRWKVFDATVQAIGEFFPLGSGAGTFVDVLRRFHPADYPGVTINRAHNDYLEWMLEFGLMAVLLIAVWLVFYVRQWGRVWKRGEWMPFRFAQAGAGIALLLMMLHTLVDFNLRIPANALFAAFLAAVFFHRPPQEGRQPSRRRRQPSGDGEGAGKPAPPPPTYEIPPENQANPFAS
jgi:O-antigen ligase